MLKVFYICYKKLRKGSGWSETSSEKSAAPSRSLYHPPVRSSMGKFHESEVQGNLENILLSNYSLRERQKFIKCSS